MKPTFIALVISLTIFSSCNSQTKEESKIGSYDTIKKQLKETEYENTKPVANIDELEMEVNNGGFSQYFINSYGGNCFETLRLLKKTGKNKTAELLEEAITLINPKKLAENDFLEKLRKHQIVELYDDKINYKLNILDEKFYKYPDGSLK